MKKIIYKVKNWFNENYLKRYLAGVHVIFINYFTFSYSQNRIVSSRSNAKYRTIMKQLNSEKYKKYFYNAVKYKLSNRNKPIPIPFTNSFIDRIKSFISLTYIYFFERELFNSIKQFRGWKKTVCVLDDKIDNYFENTTVLERNDRRLEYKIINKINHDALIRLGKIKTRRVLQIKLNE
jgi:hypothetical protein